MDNPHLRIRSSVLSRALDSSGGDPNSHCHHIKEQAAFQLHIVTLRGSISDLETLPPYMTRRGLVVGACLFTLKDGTGSIEVEVDRDCAESIDRTWRQNYTVRGILQMQGSKVFLLATEVRRGDE
jgi:hypothetical protein